MSKYKVRDEIPVTVTRIEGCDYGPTVTVRHSYDDVLILDIDSDVKYPSQIVDFCEVNDGGYSVSCCLYNVATHKEVRFNFSVPGFLPYVSSVHGRWAVCVVLLKESVVLGKEEVVSKHKEYNNGTN